MAKMTLAAARALVDAYVKNDNIAQNAPFNPTVETLSGLLIKIGKQLMLDSKFSDRLPELDAEELNYGTTIEEYFINLVLPVDFDGDGATNNAPARPAFETVQYSYELGRKTFKTTVDDSKYQAGMLGQSEFVDLTSKILYQFYQSWEVYKYTVKKQTLGRAIQKATATNLVTSLAAPTDTSTGEAFIKSVKQKVIELRDFITEGNNINGTVMSQAPELVMYIKGATILPSLEVDTWAGAFHKELAGIGVTVKNLEDFGVITGANEDAYAVLLDPRGIKVHPHQINTTSNDNAQGEFRNFYLHSTFTAHISKVTNLHIWKPAA